MRLFFKYEILVDSLSGELNERRNMQITKKDIIVVVEGRDTKLTTILSSSKECLLDVRENLFNVTKIRTKCLWFFACLIVLNGGFIIPNIIKESISNFDVFLIAFNSVGAIGAYSVYRSIEKQEQIGIIAVQEIDARIKEMN